MKTEVLKSLNPDRIEKKIKFNRKLVFFKSTASTNDIAWEYAKTESNDGLAVFAENQTAGRGRRARQWASADGMSVLCSIILGDRTLPSDAITLAVAVAIAEAIDTATGLLARIKWPNDIYMDGKKVAGVLVESRNIGGRNVFVIGFGINCNQPEEFFKAHHLSKQATSIALQSGNLCNRSDLAAIVLDSIEKWLRIASNDTDEVTSRWRQLSNQLGERISVEYNNQVFTGQCINVDPAKGIVIQLDRGGVRMFDAAHTTVVK